MTRSIRSQLAIVFVALAISVTGLAVRGLPPRVNLHAAAQTGSLAQVHRCIAWGVDVNSTGKMTFTPLHEAAFQGHVAVAESLLAAGADVDAVTDVHVARESPVPPSEMAMEDRPVTSNGPSRETPLYWAVCRGHQSMVRVLLAHGANPNAVVRREAMVGDETPLRAATELGDQEIVALLRKHGAVK